MGADEAGGAVRRRHQRGVHRAVTPASQPRKSAVADDRITFVLMTHRPPPSLGVAAVLTAAALIVTSAGSSVRAVAPPEGKVFINEIHYDNAGTDTGEAIEVAGPAGTDLTGWTVVLYNGSGGASYDTDALSGVLADQGGGFGTTSISYPRMASRTAFPTAMALVDNCGVVQQFLSYEGAFTAAGGPADGLTSTDIGVIQNGSGADRTVAGPHGQWCLVRCLHMDRRRGQLRRPECRPDVHRPGRSGRHHVRRSRRVCRSPGGDPHQRRPGLWPRKSVCR